MRARKNTSGIGNCQIPGKRYGIMSAPPGTEKIAPYNSRTGNTRILLLRIIPRYGNRIGIVFFPNEWQRDFFVKLALYLQKLIDAIIQDPEGFNDYVANHLPYQQRNGRIARKEFNRIEPRFKIEVEDETTAIKALEDSVCKNFGRPLDTMTICSYCKILSDRS